MTRRSLSFEAELALALDESAGRLGKAFRIGQGIAGITAHAIAVLHRASATATGQSTEPPFATRQLARIRALLEDLNGAFPRFAARAVSESLGEWEEAAWGYGGHWLGSEGKVVLPRQAELWHNLLAGETPADAIVRDEQLSSRPLPAVPMED